MFAEGLLPGQFIRLDKLRAYVRPGLQFDCLNPGGPGGRSRHPLPPRPRSHLPLIDFRVARCLIPATAGGAAFVAPTRVWHPARTAPRSLEATVAFGRPDEGSPHRLSRGGHTRSAPRLPLNGARFPRSAPPFREGTLGIRESGYLYGFPRFLIWPGMRHGGNAKSPVSNSHSHFQRHFVPKWEAGTGKRFKGIGCNRCPSRSRRGLERRSLQDGQELRGGSHEAFPPWCPSRADHLAHRGI